MARDFEFRARVRVQDQFDSHVDALILEHLRDAINNRTPYVAVESNLERVQSKAGAQPCNGKGGSHVGEENLQTENEQTPLIVEAGIGEEHPPSIEDAPEIEVVA